MLLPGRLPPKSGFPNWIHNWAFINLKTRDGRSFRCQLSELWPILEMFGYEAYSSSQDYLQEAKQIVDIGANVGAASAWMSIRAPNAKIIAIEPDPVIASKLSENFKRFRIQDRSVVIQAAVGSKPGWCVLEKESSSSINTSTLSVDADTPEHKIPVIGLNEILEMIPSRAIDVLKIDCEGGEFSFFDGARSDHISTIKFIIGEYHLTWGDISQLEKDLNRGKLKIEIIEQFEINGTFLAKKKN